MSTKGRNARPPETFARTQLARARWAGEETTMVLECVWGVCVY
jgi:hypothetical protein